VVVNRIAHRNTWRQRLEKLLCQALSPRNTRVDVVTLLKIDVLKEVSTDRPAGIEFPNISMPGMCGIAPSTGMSRSRRYSSILGTVFAFICK
jgi:hypothetical protein